MDRYNLPVVPGRRTITVLDTITVLSEEDAGAVVVSASHGGISSGRFALRVPLAGVFFNDAGVGKDQAGIKSFDELDAAGVPAATFDCMSARIGSGKDSIENGIVSRCGKLAIELGLAPGQTVSEAAHHLAFEADIAAVTAPAENLLSRSKLDLANGCVHLLDSVSMMTAEHLDQSVVTGSHGGLISANFVFPHRPAFVSFSDAGIGKENAGIAALGVLESEGIASFCVSHQSARIGEPRDMIDSGIISAANGPAVRKGIRVGMLVSLAIDLFPAPGL